jgi:hypothetical protein
VVALGLALVLATAAAAAGPPRFVAPDLSPAGGLLPQDLAVGDFTGDGKQDVAVANLGPDAFNGGLAVLPGDGAGKLGTPVETDLGAGQGAQDVSNAVDFDGDGALDLAVLSGTSGGAGPIYPLLGNGDGTFAVGPSLPGARGHVEAGDLTGDGDADIAFVYERGLAVVRVFPGNGDGTFAAPVAYDVDWDAYDIELGDVEGDGDLDLVGASGGPIWTMLQTGGALQPQRWQFSQSLSGAWLTLADFSLDGKLDVAVLTGDPGGGNPSLQIGKGTGDGLFTPIAQYEDVTGDTGLGLAAGDWTGDGKPDLAVHNGHFNLSNVVALLRGNGDGTFSGVTYWLTGNDDIVPANLNGDGKLDLVTSSIDPGQIYATLGDTGPAGLEVQGFEAPRLHETVQLGEVATGDVNGDGRPDFVMLGLYLPEEGFAARAVTHLGLGRARFGAAKVSPAGPTEVYDGPTEIVLADVNEDGRRDIVAAVEHFYPKTGNVWVMLGRGDGTFQLPLKYTTGDHWTDNLSLAVADVTGDGHLDVVAHGPGQGWQIAVLPGRGDGTFRPEITSGESGPAQASTLVADFTGDGKLDVAAIISTGNEDFGGGDVLLHRGNGDGTFTLIQTLHVSSNPHGGSGRVANLNGDTRPDIAFSGARGFNGGVDGVWVLLNQGGAFAAPVHYGAPWSLSDVADLDVDGDVDLVGPSYGALLLRLNDGAGSFGVTQQQISLDGTVRARDWNADGKSDLLALKNTTKPLFGVYVNATG